jgi:hypothetical protein
MSYKLHGHILNGLSLHYCESTECQTKSKKSNEILPQMYFLKDILDH